MKVSRNYSLNLVLNFVYPDKKGVRLFIRPSRLANAVCLKTWKVYVFIFLCALATLRATYSTITQSLALRPKTSGEYISSALEGGTTKVPGVVARAT